MVLSVVANGGSYSDAMESFHLETRILCEIRNFIPITAWVFTEITTLIG